MSVTRHFAITKVKGGKLIRCELEKGKKPDGTEIVISVKFSGDFFLHPEDSIENLEDRLMGCRVSDSDLLSASTSALANAECIGAGALDFTEIVLKASASPPAQKNPWSGKEVPLMSEEDSFVSDGTRFADRDDDDGGIDLLARVKEIEARDRTLKRTDDGAGKRGLDQDQDQNREG